MNDLKERMCSLGREVLQAGRQFRTAGRNPDVPPKQALLDLQQRLDHLRQATWDARKLCDPYLVPFRCDLERPMTRTLTERIVRVVDAQRRTA